MERVTFSSEDGRIFSFTNNDSTKGIEDVVNSVREYTENKHGIKFKNYSSLEL